MLSRAEEMAVGVEGADAPTAGVVGLMPLRVSSARRA